MSATTTILFIVTSHAMLANTGNATGVWLEELTTPYYMFKDAGFEVEIASVKGGSVPIDPKSLEEDTEKPESVARYLEDNMLQRTMQSSLAIEDLDVEKFDAIFFPGGHGTMFDFPNNKALAKAIHTTLSNDGYIAAVCHGPAVLIGVNDNDGKPVIAGKKISSFTNAEEEAVELTDEMPFLLETKLKELGAKFEANDNFQPHAVRDGQIITGQNPASSEKVAELLIEALK